MAVVLKFPTYDKTAKELAKEHFKLIGMKNGVLPGFKLLGSRVWLMVYNRPEMSKGGIIKPQQVIDEEKNQGKACLVIAMGPTAFVSDKNYDFAGVEAKVGDWVSIYVYETRPVKIHGYPCRRTMDTNIESILPHPEAIY